MKVPPWYGEAQAGGELLSFSRAMMPPQDDVSGQCIMSILR